MQGMGNAFAVESGFRSSIRAAVPEHGDAFHN
jgi:hypothetical protein